ncbi:unnamed protein product [Gongylonema pulchrum]|uniref:S1 motif domain-containing protein n=1 Tax=Gongylonema pulchrum TaxID=637853 RepID=A0A183EG91_9BILA|nr:unnamed protein product [Gongylonema pulchrum]
MVRSALKELNWLVENNSSGLIVPEIGRCINVKIKEISGDTAIVKSTDGSDLKGYARITNSADLKETIETMIKNKTQLNAKVLLRKKNYAVAVAELENAAFVVCIPTRMHPNINPQYEEKIREIGDVCAVTPKLVFERVIIGETKKAKKEEVFSKKLMKSKPQEMMTDIKLKPFGIYRAKVIGMWHRGADESPCAVELQFPGKKIGRLHACEFDEHFLEESSQPARNFLQKYEGKTVTVKVVCFTRIKETRTTKVLRVAECTMKSTKLKETKKKQSLMNYPQTYMQGSLIPVFVCKGPHIGVVRVEASPLWNGVIRKQNLRDENLACF